MHLKNPERLLFFKAFKILFLRISHQFYLNKFIKIHYKFGHFLHHHSSALIMCDLDYCHNLSCTLQYKFSLYLFSTLLQRYYMKCKPYYVKLMFQPFQILLWKIIQTLKHVHFIHKDSIPNKKKRRWKECH